VSPGLRPGDEWGSPTDAEPDLLVHGGDADLAAALGALGPAPGPLVRYLPRASDLAPALGLAADATDPAAPARGIALGLDALDTSLGRAVNAVVVGRDPVAMRWWHRRRPVSVTVDGRHHHDGPALAVVVANGQYLAGRDAVPRGHPGDGRIEVQVYAPGPAERGPMRRRMTTGTHLPHPRVHTTTGREVRVRSEPGTRITLDGVPHPGRADTDELVVRVVPGAYRLLI
jgi:hypothetical protein